jgi:hypothetical protein
MNKRFSKPRAPRTPPAIPSALACRTDDSLPPRRSKIVSESFREFQRVRKDLQPAATHLSDDRMQPSAFDSCGWRGLKVWTAVIRDPSGREHWWSSRGNHGFPQLRKVVDNE